MFKSPSVGWQLRCRMLRLDETREGPFGLGNKAQSTRDAAAYIADIVREEIAQDRTLVWC